MEHQPQTVYSEVPVSEQVFGKPYAVLLNYAHEGMVCLEKQTDVYIFTREQLEEIDRERDKCIADFMEYLDRDLKLEGYEHKEIIKKFTEIFNCRPE